MKRQFLWGMALAVSTAPVGWAEEVFEFPDVEAAAEVQFERAVPQLAVAGPMADDDIQVAAMMDQFRPMLGVELSFAKRAAELNAEQVAKLVEGCREPFRDLCRKAAKNQNGFHGAMMVHGGPMATSLSFDKLLEKLVEKQLEEVVDEEQRERYVKELKAREEFRKEAALNQLVAMYDEALIFTDEQRVKVRESLAKQYKPQWADCVEAIAQFSDGYFPVVPDAAVVPHLNIGQKKMWQRLQKVSASMGMGNNMWGSLPIDDVDLAPLARAANAAPAEGVEAQDARVRNRRP